MAEVMRCPHCEHPPEGAIRDPRAIAAMQGRDKFVTCVMVCSKCQRMWPARNNPGVPWMD